MRIFITLMALIILTLSAKAQPGGYTPGTQVVWNFNGRDHGFFMAQGSSNFHVLICWLGDGETNSSNYQTNSPQKMLRDAGQNWDGKTFYSGTDTIRWIVFSLFNQGGWTPDYQADIDHFFSNITDSFPNARIHFAGLSGGVARMNNFIINDQTHNSPNRLRYSTAIHLSGCFQSAAVIDSMRDVNGCFMRVAGTKRHWVWSGATDATCVPGASDQIYTSLIDSAGVWARRTNQAGAGHTATQWDSCYSLLGADSVTNRWLWMALVGTVTPLSKISNISYLDLIEYTGQPLGSYMEKNFDEQSADPGNGILTPTPNSTNNVDNPIYFSSFNNNEWRFVVNLRGSYKMNEIWMYSNNSFFGDTINFYKGNFKIGWTKIGAKYIAATTTGWISIDLPGTDTTNFILVGFKGAWQPVFGKNGIPSCEEIIFYGDLLGSRQATLKTYPYTGDYRTRPTMREFAGVNEQIGYVQNYYIRMKMGHRQGLQQEWMEGAAALLDYPSNTYDFNASGLYPTQTFKTERYVADSVVNVLGQMYFTFLINCNARYISQGGPTEGHFVNNFGDNPYLVANYTRMGNYSWMRAAQYGETIIDTNLIPMTGVPKYTALGTMPFHENGNEVDKYWGGQDSMTGAESDKLFIAPAAYMAQTQMDFDGFENTYTPRVGIKNADTNTELLTAGTVGFDTTLLRSRFAMGRLMRNDSVDVLTKAWNFHYYNTNGTSGTHPARDSLTRKVDSVVDYCYRIDSLKEIWITEAGFDANPGSIYGIIHSDSYTDRQTQAIGRLFLEVEYSRSRVDKVFIYNMAWNASDADAGSYQTSQEYKNFISIAGNYPQTSHFVGFQFDSLLRNYRYNSTISYGWHTDYNVKYVSSTEADSAIHFAAYPNTTGLTHAATLAVGTGKTVKKVVFSLTTYAPTITDITNTLYNSATGNISDTLEGMPVLYIVTTADAEPSVLRNLRYRLRF